MLGLWMLIPVLWLLMLVLELAWSLVLAYSLGILSWSLVFAS